ncbi:MAG TPA: DUF3592 domain-containing protein [Pyrinomonadaceae bacterium]|jgi:hypothetical protein
MDKFFRLLETGLSSLIFTGIGCLFLWLSLLFLRRTKRFIGESLQTDGNVVRLHEVYDEGSVTFAPVIRYTASDGIAREFTDSTSSRPASYNVGDPVKILYHRQNPKDARIATTFRLYLISIIFGFVALVLLAVGIGQMLWHLFF